MSDLPDRRSDGPPARRLTSEEFELVIRRAAELQSRSLDDAGSEGIAEAEVLRIGRELGLSGEHVGRALAEVQTGAPPESGLAARLMGGSRLTVSRAVSGDGVELARGLEAYLVEHEFLVVQRRLGDRTIYVRASGAFAAVARATTGIFRRAPLLEVASLDVTIRALEPGRCWVSLGTDLKGERTGHLMGGAALGLGLGSAGGGILALVVAPPAALVALPIAAAAMGGMRYAYREAAKKVEVQLEALLDRVEHGELRAR